MWKLLVYRNIPVERKNTLALDVVTELPCSYSLY